MDYDEIKKYEKMVYKIANKFYGEKEDLYQAGYLGLLKAYKNYKETSNTKFSTYAFNYIYGEIYEESNKRLIKINKKNLKIYKDLCLIKDALTQKYGKEVSIKMVCEYLKIDYNKVYSIFNSMNIVNTYNNSLFYTDNIDDLILVKEALKKLKTLEKNIIKDTYFFDKKQNEIAKKYGISQVKVSRTLKMSKNKLKKYLTC